MISFDEAAQIVVAHALPVGHEEVPASAAHGRTLATPVVARAASPLCDLATMDGYAVSDDDLCDGLRTLPVAATVYAGDPPPLPLPRQSCARIFTGAPLPAGADRVVMQEQVLAGDREATFTGMGRGPRFIRRRGSDFTAGEVLLDAGTVLGPRALVVAAAADCGNLTCWRAPRVTLIATGDELARAGTTWSRAGAIPDSASPGVAALVGAWGGRVLDCLLLPDDAAAISNAADNALAQSDLVVVIGGASVGDRDLSRAALATQGTTEVFTKVAMKPGKPVWLARRGRDVGNVLVMGLPGNPTSAMVTARLLLAPLVAGLAGRDPHAAWEWQEVLLGAPMSAGSDRETFFRARLEDTCAIPLGNQDSGSQATLAVADLLLRQSVDAPAREAGEPVEALAF